jgi:hypothetical protein
MSTNIPRLPSEREKPYRALCDYAAEGRGRAAIQDWARAASDRPPWRTVYRWAAQYRWVERLSAFDRGVQEEPVQSPVVGDVSDEELTSILAAIARDSGQRAPARAAAATQLLALRGRVAPRRGAPVDDEEARREARAARLGGLESMLAEITQSQRDAIRAILDPESGERACAAAIGVGRGSTAGE